MLTRRFTSATCQALLVCLALVAPHQLNLDASADDPPLIEAVKNEDVEAVSTLLRGRAAVNERQSDGATALHWGAYRDDLDIVDMLLRAGADVNAVNRLGASPLWLAAMNGSAQLMGRLLEAGADANVALPEGETPLMTAARAGTAAGVRLLVAAGADVEARESTRDQTALMWAVAQGHHHVVRELIDAGADVTARSKVRPRLMSNEGVFGGAFDSAVVENLGDFTPLMFAARRGDVESARLLLASGADINDIAGNNASALVMAIHSGHSPLAEFLLDNGADPNADGAGYTALHAAVLRGELEAVKALLAHGADPNPRLKRATPGRRSSEDWMLKLRYESATPFWLAALYREPEIMRALAEGGAEPLLTTMELWRRVGDRAGGVGPPEVIGGFITPIMAALQGTSDRGRFVTSSPDPMSEERLTLETVSVAADLGVDVNAADQSGTTALHEAAARNLKTIIRFLGERGALLDVTNSAGRTPLDLAKAGAGRGQALVGQGPTWPSPNAVDVLLDLGATPTTNSGNE
jgi:ankyrin repeat protein